MTNGTLTVHDPRLHDRVFVLEDGNCWHSLGTDIVVFETENYAKFTDGLWLGKLLKVLIEQAGAAQFRLRVHPPPSGNLPDWLRHIKIDHGHLSCTVRSEDVDQFAALYDSKSDYGIWTFHASQLPYDTNSDKSLPEVVLASAQVGFHLEVDLDGLAIGFVRSQYTPDSAVAALSSV